MAREPDARRRGRHRPGRGDVPRRRRAQRRRRPPAGDVPRVRRHGAVGQQRARLRGRQRRRRRGAEGRGAGGHGHGLVRTCPQFDTTDASQNCSTHFYCTWDKTVAKDWKRNRNWFGVQFYYFLNTFHDHLLAAPIGFTEAAGNFQVDEHERAGARRRRRPGAPPRRGEHRERVPRRGPRQQRELLDPGRRRARRDADVPAARGDLGAEHPVRRLGQRGGDRVPRVRARVVQPPGHDARRHPVAERAAVGLDGRGLERLVRDRLHGQPRLVHRHAGERRRDRVPLLRRRRGRRSGRPRRSTARSASPRPNCPVDGFGSGPGGYTYADYGNIVGQPEVHADGEIWVQTLWEMRELLGSRRDGVDRHARHGAVTAGAVVPGHAERDPAGRRGRLRGIAPGRALDVVRRARHGLLRGGRGRQRRAPGGGLRRRPRTARSTRAARSPAPSRTPCRARRCRACTSGSRVTCRGSAATSAT